jgi:hypothetical protein
VLPSGMALLARRVAVLLLFSMFSGSLGAAACAFDCDSETSSRATHPIPPCHETTSRDSRAVQLTHSPVVCQHDHQGVTAELSSRHDSRGARSVDVARLGAHSASSAPTLLAENSSRWSVRSAAQAPPRAPRPLRL